MVRQGWATADRHTRFGYASEEGDARLARRGIWAGRSQPPS